MHVFPIIISTNTNFVETSQYINYYVTVGDCVYFHLDFDIVISQEFVTWLNPNNIEEMIFLDDCDEYNIRNIVVTKNNTLVITVYLIKKIICKIFKQLRK